MPDAEPPSGSAQSDGPTSRDRAEADVGPRAFTISPELSIRLHLDRADVPPPASEDPAAFAAWERMMPHSDVAVQRRVLRQVHGDRCGLCGGVLDFSAVRPAPLSVDVDHCLPRARGGADLWGNLQLAHHACNAFRLHFLQREAHGYEPVLRNALAAAEGRRPEPVDVAVERLMVWLNTWEFQRACSALTVTGPKQQTVEAFREWRRFHGSGSLGRYLREVVDARVAAGLAEPWRVPALIPIRRLVPLERVPAYRSGPRERSGLGERIIIGDD